MGQKHEMLTSPNLFYCFVDFGKSLADQPKTWVVPSEIVAKSLREMHQDWLNTPGAKGQQRNDNALRRFMPEYRPLATYAMGWLDPYFENWSSLETASKESGHK